MNRFLERRHRQQMENTEANTLSRNGSVVAHPVIIERCDGDHSVKRQLDAAQSSQQILRIITRHHGASRNASLYGKAMQKCNVLRDWATVRRIMRMLLCDAMVAPQLTEFHVFMNSMARSDNRNAMRIIDACFECFECRSRRHYIRDCTQSDAATQTVLGTQSQ